MCQPISDQSKRPANDEMGRTNMSKSSACFRRWKTTDRFMHSENFTGYGFLVLFFLFFTPAQVEPLPWVAE